MCATKSSRSGIARFNAIIAVALDMYWGGVRRRVDVRPSAAAVPKIIALLLMILRIFVLPQKSVLTAAALILPFLLSALSGYEKRKLSVTQESKVLVSAQPGWQCASPQRSPLRPEDAFPLCENLFSVRLHHRIHQIRLLLEWKAGIYLKKYPYRFRFKLSYLILFF